MSLFGLIVIAFLSLSTESPLWAAPPPLADLLAQTASPTLLFPTLADEERGTLLGRIAEASFVALWEVPRQGLASQQAELERIITLRNWLFATQYPPAYLLGLQMQKGVDSVIVYEVERVSVSAVQPRAAGAPPTPAVDLPLVRHLLELNALDEAQVIAYTLTLDGEFAEADRKSRQRKPTDPITAAPPPRLHDPKKGGQVPYMTIDQYGDELFEQARDALEQSRDVRLLPAVYERVGGFPRGQALEDALDDVLGTRHTRDSMRPPSRIGLDASKILEYYRDQKVGSHELKLVMRFYLYLHDREWFLPYWKEANQLIDSGSNFVVPSAGITERERQRREEDLRRRREARASKLPDLPPGTWLRYTTAAPPKPSGDQSEK